MRKGSKEPGEMVAKCGGCGYDLAGLAADQSCPECGKTSPAQAATVKCPVPKWGRRLGAAAFMFFLIKGLLWLAVPTLVAMGLFSK